MKFQVKSEIRGRIRFHILRKRLNEDELNAVRIYLKRQKGVDEVKVYSHSGNLAVCYHCSQREMYRILRQYSFERDYSVTNAELQDLRQTDSIRQINSFYTRKVYRSIGGRLAILCLLPPPVRNLIALWQAAKVVKKAGKTLASGRYDVGLLDAATVAWSIGHGDFDTAGSHAYAVSLSEVMDNWVQRQKIVNIARMVSLNIDTVCQVRDGQEYQVPTEKIQVGDLLLIKKEEMIPFDGTVMSGAGMVVQTSLTGNMLPATKQEADPVYAGCVLEEGSFLMRVDKARGFSLYDRITSMALNSVNLDPHFETQVQKKVDNMVPGLLLGGGAVALLTGDGNRASAFFDNHLSYSLNLVLPLLVLRACKEASSAGILVKGGLFLENLAKSDTIIFDKTGTLTTTEPVLTGITSLGNMGEDEILRIAACIEEHHPHVIANAIVRAAAEKNLLHEEMHSEVSYVVAHGVVTEINGKRAVIGSYHFLYEELGYKVPEEVTKILAEEDHAQEHHLYLAIAEKTEAVFCIEDTIKDDAERIIRELKRAGFRHIVLLSGDSDHSTGAAAKILGISEYRGGLLPGEKAEYIEQKKAEGNYVVMVGDGINDSLALSKADVGIAVTDGARIAREVADVITGEMDLSAILLLRQISCRLLREMEAADRMLTGMNKALIALCALGLISPAGASSFYQFVLLWYLIRKF